MKITLLCLLFLSITTAKADPLKKVLKRTDYCSPLQKMIGGCGKKDSKEDKEEEQAEDKAEIKKARKKAEEKKEEEEADEFLR